VIARFARLDELRSQLSDHDSLVVVRKSHDRIVEVEGANQTCAALVFARIAYGSNDSQQVGSDYCLLGVEFLRSTGEYVLLCQRGCYNGAKHQEFLKGVKEVLEGIRRGFNIIETIHNRFAK
jgi:hypothetical protein